MSHPSEARLLLDKRAQACRRLGRGLLRHGVVSEPGQGDRARRGLRAPRQCSAGRREEPAPGPTISLRTWVASCQLWSRLGASVSPLVNGRVGLEQMSEHGTGQRLGSSWECVRNARSRASALTCCVGVAGDGPPRLSKGVPVPLDLVPPRTPAAPGCSSQRGDAALRTHSIYDDLHSKNK